MPLLDDCHLRGVLSNAIDEIWPHVIPLLERALAFDDDKYDVQFIYNALKETSMQLWVVFNRRGELKAFCITRIDIYPKGNRLNIMFAAGMDVYRWVHLTEILLDFATCNNCKKVEIYGRPGWEKLLGPLGFKKIHTVLSVDLPGKH